MSRDLLMPSTRAFGTQSDNALKASLRKMREEREAKQYKSNPSIVRRTACEYCGDKNDRSTMVKTETGYLCLECAEKVSIGNEPIEPLAPDESAEIPQKAEPRKEPKTRRTRCYRCETLFNRDELTKGKDDGLYCVDCVQIMRGDDEMIKQVSADKAPIVRVSPEYITAEYPKDFQQDTADKGNSPITSATEPRRCFYCGGSAFEILKDGTCRCVGKECGAVYTIDKPTGGK